MVQLCIMVQLHVCPCDPCGCLQRRMRHCPHRHMAISKLGRTALPV